MYEHVLHHVACVNIFSYVSRLLISPWIYLEYILWVCAVYNIISLKVKTNSNNLNNHLKTSGLDRNISQEDNGQNYETTWLRNNDKYQYKKSRLSYGLWQRLDEFKLIPLHICDCSTSKVSNEQCTHDIL